MLHTYIQGHEVQTCIYFLSVFSLRNPNTGPLKCVIAGFFCCCLDHIYVQTCNEVNTHVPTPHSTQKHTHAHTTSHSPFAPFNIRDCGSSSTPNRDMLLCFSAPPSMSFLMIADVEKLNNRSLFSPLPKTVQLLFVSVMFLCCCCCCGPQTQDNGSFRRGLVSVSSCTRRRRCGQEGRRVPVLQRILNASG